jgi:hypothetical protein
LAPPLKTVDRPEYDFQTFAPKLFVLGGSGYSLGEIVDGWWWEKRREHVRSKLGDLNEDKIGYCGEDTGLVRLTLATLPSSEFTVYWKRLRPYPKGDKRLQKNREEDRAKLGWVTNKVLETREHQFLEHKYFSVRHYPI